MDVEMMMQLLMAIAPQAYEALRKHKAKLKDPEEARMLLAALTYEHTLKLLARQQALEDLVEIRFSDLQKRLDVLVRRDAQQQARRIKPK